MFSCVQPSIKVTKKIKKNKKALLQRLDEYVKNLPKLAKLPLKYQIKPPQVKNFKLEAIGQEARIIFYSKSFSQGELCQFVIPSFAIKNIQIFGYLSNSYYKLKLSKFKFGYTGFYPISTSHKKLANFIVKYAGNAGESSYVQKINFKINKVKWPVYRSALLVKKYSNIYSARDPQVKKRIAAGYKLKRSAFRHKGKMLLDNKRSHPRNEHYITSPFWVQRYYKRYRKIGRYKQWLKPQRSTHHGLDLKGYTGQPVFAIARGQVVLSEKLFYEGNIMMIDHGLGLISGYMHMSKRFAKTGDIIKAGDIAGLTGATGMVTGAHLHIFLYFMGYHLQPLSLISLPLFNR